ncbi:MAG: hypothetical protein ABJ263_16535 [Tateyamaria sp.]
MSTPNPMEEIRASFFIKCEELLEAAQDGLQQLEERRNHQRGISRGLAS